MLVPRIVDYQAMDRFFDDMFTPVFPRVSREVTSSKQVMMSTDIEELEDCYVMKVELPGYAKEDIKASLDNGYLTLTAEKEERQEDKDEEGRFIRRERYRGSCKRSFFVGQQMKEEDIQASFTDGILQVTIPKNREEKKIEEKRYITVN